MDEEIEDFIEEEREECCSSDTSSGVDSDYEFDAPKFFDFTRSEPNSEADEAERWFRYAPNYPPSPFIVKLNLGKILCEEGGSCSSKLQETKNITSSISNSGISPQRPMNEDIQEVRTKSTAKPTKARSSTLMKPTASLLAKQNKLPDVYSSRLCQRSQKSFLKIDEKGLRSTSGSLQSPLGSEELATKRQKLEGGFLRKVAHLKHQALLLHKISKKVTVPKDPQLETMQRAERHRSKSNSESREHANQKLHSFKARPLNRKILERPATLPPKKSAPKSKFFRVFNFKTMERAMQHSSSNVSDRRSDDSVVQSSATSLRSSHSGDVPNKEKCRNSPKSQSRPLKKKNITSNEHWGVNRSVRQEATISSEARTLNDERLSHNPPVELFSKLSIRSRTETNTASDTKVHQYPKGSKENAPDAFQLEFWRCMGKLNQCGGGNGVLEIGCHPNINRSLDIR